MQRSHMRVLVFGPAIASVLVLGLAGTSPALVGTNLSRFGLPCNDGTNLMAR
jgi:hypothetical protein